jgi:hypothetical protein
MCRHLFLVVALHGEGLARPSLAVCKYSCMIALDNLLDHVAYAESVIDFALTGIRLKYLVKLKRSLLLRRLSIL